MRNVYATIPGRALRELYIRRRLSLRDIAKAYQCDLGVIARALRHHGISVRSPTKALHIEPRELRSLYKGKKLSTYEIAARYGCDPKTVYRYLKLHKIASRPMKRIRIERDTLDMLYTRRRKSLQAIASMYGYSAAGVLKKLKQFSIRRRSTSEANIKHVKKDFDGTADDKAYLIGFRIGDLGVRSRGNLVYISSGTTKQTQSRLIRTLFIHHGPVWVSKRDKRGAMNICVALNRSFAFLLPKHRHVPKWIMRSRHTFFAFVAGYTDAEGNIQISGGRARYRLRSCDQGILKDIHIAFNRYGVAGLHALDRRAGVDSRGVRLHRDCWSVVVNDRRVLYRLLMILLPLLRHEKRRSDAEAALVNARRRIK